jgi:prepilin-type N-terminal cleavage/methylation domain-containing protein
LRTADWNHGGRNGFTLFELILAIALSATLLALIGTAINLYLLRVDASRTRVEEAQLARSILALIAADLRATTVYRPQETGSATQSVSFRGGSDNNSSGGGSQGGSTGVPTGGSVGSSSTGSGSLGGSDAASLGGVSAGSSVLAMQPGVNGNLYELILDVTRLPRLDELFTAVPAAGTTPATPVAAARPSDAKTVRYFMRQAAAVDPSDPATTVLDPNAQLRVGGLVRQTLDQAVRTAAETTGNTALLEGGQVLVAPEVAHVEFRYFDGAAAVEEWNMQQQGGLPPAVEVRLWLTTADDSASLSAAPTSTGALLPGTRMYSQTVDLPLATADTSATTASSSSNSTGQLP